MYRNSIRMYMALLLVTGAARLEAGPMPGPEVGVHSDITQQNDPKKLREVTASVARSTENETVTLKTSFPEDINSVPVKVALYNILGKLIEVHPTSIVSDRSYDFRFLTKGLPSGPYILVLECNGQRIVNKVMISR